MEDLSKFDIKCVINFGKILCKFKLGKFLICNFIFIKVFSYQKDIKYIRIHQIHILVYKLKYCEIILIKVFVINHTTTVAIVHCNKHLRISGTLCRYHCQSTRAHCECSTYPLLRLRELSELLCCQICHRWIWLQPWSEEWKEEDESLAQTLQTHRLVLLQMKFNKLYFYK